MVTLEEFSKRIQTSILKFSNQVLVGLLETGLPSMHMRIELTCTPGRQSDPTGSRSIGSVWYISNAILSMELYICTMRDWAGEQPAGVKLRARWCLHADNRRQIRGNSVSSVWALGDTHAASGVVLPCQLQLHDHECNACVQVGSVHCLCLWSRECNVLTRLVVVDSYRILQEYRAGSSDPRTSQMIKDFSVSPCSDVFKILRDFPSH